MIRLPGWLAGGLALLLALVATPVLAAPTFPALSGRVVDDAHILSDPTKAKLTEKLAALETSTGRQVVVVTLPSLQGQEIEDYGYQLGRKWQIGEKGTNTGALFIIAPNERKTRIEVGYGLEPIITDALSSVILQRAVLPRFKAGDMEGGIVAGTDALIEQLSLPDDQARARAAVKPVKKAQWSGGMVGALFMFIFIAFIVSRLFGGGRRRGRGGGLGEALPWIILGGLSSSSHRDHDDWGGGGGGGGWGGGGGGGFSGGGGSFGGGGSSGSW